MSDEVGICFTKKICARCTQPYVVAYACAQEQHYQPADTLCVSCNAEYINEVYSSGYTNRNIAKPRGVHLSKKGSSSN